MTEIMRVPGNPHCPACSTKLDGAGRLAGAIPPEAGDHTICVHCLTSLIFDDDPAGGLLLRYMTATELIEAADSPEFHATRKTVIAARRRDARDD
jgi:hypothetical protein